MLFQVWGSYTYIYWAAPLAESPFAVYVDDVSHNRRSFAAIHEQEKMLKLPDRETRLVRALSLSYQNPPRMK